MDKKRENELILLSTRIQEKTHSMVTEYLEKTYAGSGPESMNDQLEDWLYVAQESTAYILGNALAVLEPEAAEEEIRLAADRLRMVSEYVRKKSGGESTPDRLQ